MLPILDDPKMRSVDNDRENLILNDRVLALRAWIYDRINELTEKWLIALAVNRMSERRNLVSLSSKQLAKIQSLMSEVRATLLEVTKRRPSIGIGTRIKSHQKE